MSNMNGAVSNSARMQRLEVVLSQDPTRDAAICMPVIVFNGQGISSETSCEVAVFKCTAAVLLNCMWVKHCVRLYPNG